MRKLFNNLYLVNDDAGTGQAGAAFLIVQPAGNVLLPVKHDISAHVDDINRHGPVSQILIGDRHHVSDATVALARRYDLPLTASTIEAQVLAKKKLMIGNPLDFEIQSLGKNLQALPTPGHTKGAFSYLWTTRSHRYLFIGDTLVPADGRWQYWVTKPNRKTMSETLAYLQTVDFDVMLCNSFAATDGPVTELTKATKTKRLKSLQKDLST